MKKAVLNLLFNLSCQVVTAFLVSLVFRYPAALVWQMPLVYFAVLEFIGLYERARRSAK